jgi:serine/threonine protein kinase/formylglycine-generating enzyme required for sulfatase activity
VNRLLGEPEPAFWTGVECLCAEQPGLAEAIRAEARRQLAAAQAVALPTATHSPAHEAGRGADLRPGDRVGAFAILSEIGHGGMGSVYLAEQKEPVHRRVALKVIKLGMDTKAVLARFEAERQALARMDHSHIAKVYEAGATPEGRPYFAMEHVKGIPITRYCDDNKLSVEARLALFQQVCSGVQHAHQKGVIHRDLTPNNVLVSVQDGRPAAKIIDFGLARATDHRLTEKTLFTAQGVILGTPEYMSPEQAGLNALDVDMRSDVYTLGVLLYELLTGRLPFEAKELRERGYDAMCKTIREQDPPKPSTKVTTEQGGAAAAAKLRRTDASSLLKRLRGDLDWGGDECLEKDRNRRYETVAALSDDVQRHLDCEPVLARAPSVRYRLGKLVRRYRGQLAAAGLVFGALVVGLALATYFWLDSREQAAAAKRQEGIAQAKAKEAEEKADEALARKREFDQLAVKVRCERVLAAEAELYPAWPRQIAAMEDWLAQADEVLAARRDIDNAIAELRKRALPLTAQAAEQLRRRNPRLASWQRQLARLAALEHAQAVWRGRVEPIRLEPTAEEEALAPAALSELAWPLVDPYDDKRQFGQEVRALMLARLAWAKAADLPDAERAAIGRTLALAFFANGRYGDAMDQIEAALELAPAERRAEYEGYQFELQSQWSRFRRSKALVALRAEVAAVDAEVSALQYAPEDEAQRFLYETLVEIRRNLSALESDQKKAVERRLRWARGIEALTRAHPQARATWQTARAAIAKADGVVASELYAGQGIELRDQDVLGLVPIGMNPVTKLWEFYELRSAWDGMGDPAAIAIPQHITEGERAGDIEVTEATGIVFVLLPGGSFTMGSQQGDPKAPNYDPQRDDSEWLYTVALSPFFLARHELTHAQWRRLSGQASGVERLFPGGGPPSWPVDDVDWEMATGLLARHGLELPTEAQWEYGCRAGTVTPWFCALGELVLHANLADASVKRGYPASVSEAWDDGHFSCAPVGSFRPNGFGLFDTHGNVWEWTRYGAIGQFAAPRAGDGLRPRIGFTWPMHRGGSCDEVAHEARSANHRSYINEDFLGARPARALRLPD